jgi:hypothetical protein
LLTASILGGVVTANIPFDFTVNGRTLPAGKYEVTSGTTPGMLIIRNAESHETARGSDYPALDVKPEIVSVAATAGQ